MYGDKGNSDTTDQFGAGVLAQVVQRFLPAPEVQSLNPIILEYSSNNQLLIETEMNTQKERLRML